MSPEPSLNLLRYQIPPQNSGTPAAYDPDQIPLDSRLLLLLLLLHLSLCLSPSECVQPLANKQRKSSSAVRLSYSCVVTESSMTSQLSSMTSPHGPTHPPITITPPPLPPPPPTPPPPAPPTPPPWKTSSLESRSRELDSDMLEAQCRDWQGHGGGRGSVRSESRPFVLRGENEGLLMSTERPTSFR